MATQQDSNSGNSILAPYWERFAIWLCGAVIALLCLGYNDMSTKVERLDERVQILFLEKVSKQEMKEVEQRIMSRIEAGNADIISRLDLYFKTKDK